MPPRLPRTSSHPARRRLNILIIQDNLELERQHKLPPLFFKREVRKRAGANWGSAQGTFNSVSVQERRSLEVADSRDNGSGMPDSWRPRPPVGPPGATRRCASARLGDRFPTPALQKSACLRPAHGHARFWPLPLLARLPTLTGPCVEPQTAVPARPHCGSPGHARESAVRPEASQVAPKPLTGLLLR